jgi:hypothetical protein
MSEIIGTRPDESLTHNFQLGLSLDSHNWWDSPKFSEMSSEVICHQIKLNCYKYPWDGLEELQPCLSTQDVHKLQWNKKVSISTILCFVRLCFLLQDDHLISQRQYPFHFGKQAKTVKKILNCTVYSDFI